MPTPPRQHTCGKAAPEPEVQLAPPPAGRVGWRFAVAITLLYLACAFAFTRPLWHHARDGLPYGRFPPVAGSENARFVQGDHFQLHYVLWLFRNAVVDRQAPLFDDPYQFHFPDTPIRIGHYYFSFSWPYLLASLFFDDFLPYNIMVWASFLLTGWATALWLRRHVRQPWAAAIGGLVPTVAAYRLSMLFGSSPSGFVVYLVPLSLWAVDAMLDGRRLGWALVTGLALWMVAVGDLHAIFFLMLGLPFYVLLGWIARRPAWRGAARRYFLRNQLPRLGLLALGFVAVYAYLMVVRSRRIEPAVTRSGFRTAEVAIYSPTLYDIAIRTNRNNTRAIYPGTVAAALAAAGLAAALIRGGWRERWLAGGAACVAAAAYILALGPNAPWNGLYGTLRDVVPYLRYLRQTSKTLIMAMPAIALLAAFGTQALLAAAGPARRRRAALLAVVAGLLILDAGPLRHIALARPDRRNNAYDCALAHHRSGERLLCLPIWPGDSSYSSLYLYFATLYPIPTLNMYIPKPPRRYVEEVFDPLDDLNHGLVTDRALAVLDRWHVRQIVVHTEVFPDKVNDGRGPDYTIDGLLKDRRLRRVLDAPPLVLLEYRSDGSVRSNAL